jgi:zinc protease
MSPAPTAALLALLASLLPASAAAQRRPDVLPFRAVERTLPNGVHVVVIPTGFPDLVSVQIAIRAGSRNEVEPGKSGFAHFFEHMMFRGTKAYPPERYNAIVTRMGASQNAYTSDDLTNYHLTFAKEDLDQVLTMEADRFMNLDYSVEAFKTESRAVLGEYDKNASNPLVKLGEVARDSAFRVHTYKHTPMGFLADIEDMPNQYEYSRLFYARWYRPEHATIVVAGDVTAAEVLPLVEKRFGKWRRGTHRVEIPREPPPAGPVYAHVPWPTPTLPFVAVAFHGPAFSATAKDWAAADALLDLHFGPTSELYRRLVVEEQIVDAIFTDNGPNVDPGLHAVVARLKRPEDAVRVRDALLRELARARSAPPDAKDLADQVSHRRNAFVRRLDSSETIAGAVARYSVYERSYQTLNRLFRTAAALTPADVHAAAKTWITDSRLLVATLSREPLPAGIAEPPALASLAGAAAADGDVPVVTVPSKIPVVTVKLLFEAGSARDPEGKEGLAAIAADMLVGAGSRSMRIDEIHKALHPLAATFSAQVDKELVTLTGRFPRDAWRRFAEVALPQLVSPGFRDDDFRRVKDERLHALVQDLRETNDEELGKERLQANVFAGTAYGHPAAGTVEGIRAVTLDDVKEFVRQHYTRANVAVGLAADAPAPVVRELRAELGKLPEGKKPPPVIVVGRRPKGHEVEIVEKDARATAISFGHPIDVRRGDPDFVALWLARSWLGEHRSSSGRLYQRIREARGLNYGDYAYLEAFPRGMFQFVPDPNLGRRAQLFEVWIRPVIPRNAGIAVRIALHELSRLVEVGLTEEEFQATRQYLAKSAAVMTARQEQQVGHALDARWYGTPELPRYLREGLASLTREQVNAAVKRHLSPDRLSFVFVGRDAKALAEALLSDAPVTVTYEAEKPPALLEEDRLIGSTKLGIAREAIRITPVGEVFQR